MSYFLVFVGGGIGSMLRHGVNRASLALIGPNFPAGTMIVNISGSALMGIVVGWLALRSGDSSSFRLFLTTGVLGGFTTFSAFSLDAAALWRRGDHLLAGVYVLSSVTLAIAGLCLGLALARTIAGLR